MDRCVQRSHSRNGILETNRLHTLYGAVLVVTCLLTPRRIQNHEEYGVRSTSRTIMSQYPTHTDAVGICLGSEEGCGFSVVHLVLVHWHSVVLFGVCKD